MEELIKTIKKISLYYFIIGFVALILLEFYLIILSPSITSMVIVCFPEKAEDSGYKPIGETQIINNDNGTRYAQVTFFVEPNKKLLKHEFTHITQSRRFLSFPNTCKFWGFYKILREIEAYSSSYLPDKIYLKIYGNYGILND